MQMVRDCAFSSLSNKIYMSKRKFIATNRDNFGRNYERNSQELRGEKKLTDPHRDLLIPL
jgi:hypothetical protein